MSWLAAMARSQHSGKRVRVGTCSGTLLGVDEGSVDSSTRASVGGCSDQ